MPGNTNYEKLDLVTGDAYTQTRCRHMETQAESVCSPGVEFIGAELQAFHENQEEAPLSGGGPPHGMSIDLSLSNNFFVNLIFDVAVVSINNVPTTGKVVSFTIKFTADGTLRTITWPASVKWPTGAAPVMTSTAGKVDIFAFVSYDDGATWYGFVMGQNF